MKRERLLRHLRRHGCVLRRDGKEHALWKTLKRVTSKPSPVTRKSPIFWQERFAVSCQFPIRRARGGTTNPGSQHVRLSLRSQTECDFLEGMKKLGSLL